MQTLGSMFNIMQIISSFIFPIILLLSTYCGYNLNKYIQYRSTDILFSIDMIVNHARFSPTL